MPKDEMRRTVGLPTEIWKALDEDAERNRRSAVKQLEVILASVYGLGDFIEPSTRFRELFNQASKMRVEEIAGESKIVARIEPAKPSIEDVRRKFLEEVVPVHDDGVVGKRTAKRKAK